MSTPSLVATSVTTGNLNIDNLNIKELTFKAGGSGTIINNSTGTPATLTMPTASGTLINDIENAAGVFVPVYADLASSNGRAVFNGISSGNSDFLLPTPAPFGGGNIILNPGVKAVLTDSTQTLINKTLDAPKLSNLTIGSTATGFLPLGSNAGTGVVGNMTDIVVTTGFQQVSDKQLLNTSLVSPSISTINNVGTLTLPTTTGTLALTSDIPSNFVTTNTPQTISAIKTFSANPVISAINNGQNITVPSNISSIFALQSAAPQVTGNVCTYLNSSPTPAVIQDSGIAASSLATLTGTQTLTNKTISGLTATGNTISLFGGKLINRYATATTVGAGATLLSAVAVPINTAVSIDCRVIGFCTSGVDIGKYVVYNSTFAGANNAGVGAVGTVVSNSSRSMAFGGATIVAALSGTTININVNGITGDTIVWTGDIAITYQ